MPLETTWRDAAMNESLRGFNYDESMDALICAIRHAQPQYSTLILWAERGRVMSFLKSECQNLRSLLVSQHNSFRGGEEFRWCGWYGVTWNGTTIEVALEPGHNYYGTVCLTKNPEILSAFALALRNHAIRPAGRSLRYSEGWESAPDLDVEIGRVTWDDLVLPSTTATGIREAAESFFAHKEVLSAFGFAWKRGILLIGPPGTGKTMVCKAVAAALPNLPFLYVRDLREEDRKEAIGAIFKRARELAPCILAMEDLDSLFNTDANPASRTILLNELDGFASNDGLLVIASSNHPGKIDEALLKRPSRFDRVFHLGLPELAERRIFCERVLSRSELSERLSEGFDIAALAAQIAAKTDGFTPAYLKEAFAAAALQRAQEGAAVLDEHFAAAVLQQIEELRAHLKRVKNLDALVEMRSSTDAIGFRR